MKPKNFPSRKNQRRIDALTRAEKHIGKNSSWFELEEIDKSRKRIISPDQAKAIRTKKRRGDSNRGRK